MKGNERKMIDNKKRGESGEKFKGRTETRQKRKRRKSKERRRSRKSRRDKNNKPETR